MKSYPKNNFEQDSTSVECLSIPEEAELNQFPSLKTTIKRNDVIGWTESDGWSDRDNWGDDGWSETID